MTQSWLIDAFLNCGHAKINRYGPSTPSDVRCPNATAVENFKNAVRHGDIVWHAFPFNAEPELFTAELFDAVLNLTFRQNDFFAKNKI